MKRPTSSSEESTTACPGETRQAVFIFWAIGFRSATVCALNSTLKRELQPLEFTLQRAASRKGGQGGQQLKREIGNPNLFRL
ncbi:MAG TPA: hypothetical protein VHX65_20310 [Pirellulales bacterium]|nr:hypothetical protein [Pirellulales bacterium]